MPMGWAKRLTRSAGWLLALALVVGLPAAIETWRSYHQATSIAERAVVGLANLLGEQTERTIQAIDLTLVGMLDALRLAKDMPPYDPKYGASLKERIKNLPYVRALYVIGADGYIIHDTDPPSPYTSLADRPYFRAHKLDPDLGLHISQPMLSRSVGVWFIAFSRRIDNPDGSFAGLVVAAVEPRYFKRFYKGLSMGKDDLIALLLKDGTLLARIPDYENTIGKLYSDTPESNVLMAAEENGRGVTWSVSPVDGVKRVSGFRTAAGGKVVVIAGQSLDTIYDAWAEHAIVVGCASVLVWGLAVGLSLLWFKDRRREQLEQERLAQVQRLETMGRIIGGIAHDLGNTVKIARTTFTLVKPALASQTEAMALVEDADRSLKSAFDIIDRLLAFARRQELSPRATNLGELIAGFAPILRQAAGPAVDLELSIGRRLVCLVDPVQLESALLNLVLNSRDSMPDGGRIVIELHEVQAPRGKARRPAASMPPPLQPWAEIVVKDNGSGMSSEVRERAFEPFFTTRAGGSGLGLSQVLGFVHQSAGDVRIDSRPGAGTEVHLSFPTAPDVVTPPASLATAAALCDPAVECRPELTPPLRG